MEFDSFLNLDFISCFSVAEWLDDNTDYAWGIFKNDELIGYCTIGIADDKFPYGKPQTDEVARGSGTESMAVRD